ncbi:hypothetical protein [Calothrix sp. UHCC 0171]|uniref:hypothetical protein n=1 Tax=Calothrix sp. UHCC 0171 TaxID=3110245 RepID=UPI002B1F893E|nr:hypothetical protein [Calothrix sp. UHCC 0171]MEA5573417.1 hypothetical protein [Calothrix sp. UHCC 0171]
MRLSVPQFSVLHNRSLVEFTAAMGIREAEKFGQYPQGKKLLSKAMLEQHKQSIALCLSYLFWLV